MPLEIRVAEDCHVMERTGKIQVQVNEKSFVGHHNRTIHTIHLLLAIKPLCVVGIILGLPNLTIILMHQENEHSMQTNAFSPPHWIMISWANASVMHEAMKITSLHNDG